MCLKLRLAHPKDDALQARARSHKPSVPIGAVPFLISVAGSRWRASDSGGHENETARASFFGPAAATLLTITH